MHATQLLVTTSFETQVNACTSEMQGKVVQHVRLTLVSLLHDSGKVPPSRFSRRDREFNCTNNNTHLVGSSHCTTNLLEAKDVAFNHSTTYTPTTMTSSCGLR